MGMQNLDIHRSCNNYRLVSTADFVIKEFSGTDRSQEVHVEFPTIVFFRKGEALVSSANFSNVHVSDGEMIFLTHYEKYTVDVLRDVTAINCNFTRSMSFCGGFSLQRLSGFLPEGYVYEGKTLPIRKRIMDFLDLLQANIEDGLHCADFHEIKSKELFIILSAYYDKVELAEFFSPLLGFDVEFKDLILKNWQNADSVEELAAITNKSYDTFRRVFIASFGESPKQWLLSRKKEKLYREILMGNQTFTELADEYHFSSPAYFSNFCRKHFGMTAQEIRAIGEKELRCNQGNENDGR
ncbi:MAG: helix-turn-helix transcriptional regulator [Bacteroidales bacterium]|nr:helix-turn-helix transcriptional regulator [Bacteroidales bacterium]